MRSPALFFNRGGRVWQFDVGWGGLGSWYTTLAAKKEKIWWRGSRKRVTSHRLPSPRDRGHSLLHGIELKESKEKWKYLRSSRSIGSEWDDPVVNLHDQSLISRSRSKVSREIYETWKLSISYDTYTVYGIWEGMGEAQVHRYHCR